MAKDRRGPSAFSPPDRLLAVVEGPEVRPLEVWVSEGSCEPGRVFVGAAEPGFSALRYWAQAQDQGPWYQALRAFAGSLRTCAAGPLVATFGGAGDLHPVVLVQSDRSAWFEGAFPEGIRRWTPALREHYRLLVVAALRLAVGLGRGPVEVELAHPVAYRWPGPLCSIVARAIAGVARERDRVIERVWIYPCCLERSERSLALALRCAEAPVWRRRPVEPEPVLTPVALSAVGAEEGLPWRAEVFAVGVWDSPGTLERG